MDCQALGLLNNNKLLTKNFPYDSESKVVNFIMKQLNKWSRDNPTLVMPQLSDNSKLILNVIKAQKQFQATAVQRLDTIVFESSWSDEFKPNLIVAI